MTKSTSVTPLHAAPTQTAGNHRKQRELFELLEDAFDEKKGCYRKDMSDKAIAELTDLSPEYVAKVRREAFGEITLDPEVVTLLENLTVLGQQVKDLQRLVDSAITEMNHHLGKLPK